ncbi:MAG: GNAT family N-acetyltransferase [Calothrix sp. FI2-JRJ7]|jgi:GNAT superfamily N-acetyltransferase|nr:GNAT family N-acetyltransferase [Calothrix sp. FI2-JRJ7]
MLKIILADVEEDIDDIRELFYGNLCEVEPIFERELNVSFDVDEYLENDIAKLSQFTVPSCGLFLAKVNGQNAGCAGFRRNNQSTAEVKRMYVKPEYRRQGIGRALLQAVITEATKLGYAKIRLDTVFFAKEAQKLYRSFGFQEILPYSESDIPQELHPKWIFMELSC